ncbi:MAG: hypothetical protein ABID84_00295 [Chloroflexota bacterium]
MDDIYQRIEDRLQAIKDTILWSPEFLQMQSQIQHLLMLLIEQRQQLITLRIHERLQAVSLASPHLHLKAKEVGEVLHQHGAWFNGAIIESDDPIKTYSAWLKRLQDNFSRMGYDMLIREDDELPPLPFPGQEQD